MRNSSTIMRDVQRIIRQELDRRRIALKIVAAESQMSYSTLCSYFPGNERGSVEKQPAELPGGAIRDLYGAIPDDLMSLLAPDGWSVIRTPAGVDYDEVSAACRDFIDVKERAHHPESEAGRDIGPGEDRSLGEKVARMRP